MTCRNCGSPLIVRTRTPAGEDVLCCPNIQCERFAKDYLAFSSDDPVMTTPTANIPWPKMEEYMPEVRDEDPPEKPVRVPDSMKELLALYSELCAEPNQPNMIVIGAGKPNPIAAAVRRGLERKGWHLDLNEKGDLVIKEPGS